MSPEETPPKIDYIAVVLVSIFFILLTYAGYLSYRSIDWDVLDRLEKAPLILPTVIPTLPQSTPSSKI